MRILLLSAHATDVSRLRLLLAAQAATTTTEAQIPVCRSAAARGWARRRRRRCRRRGRRLRPASPRALRGLRSRSLHSARKTGMGISQALEWAQVITRRGISWIADWVQGWGSLQTLGLSDI